MTSTTHRSSPIALPNWQKWLPYLTLVAAVFVAYANVYENKFLFDDDLIILMNENLRGWDFIRIFSTSTTSGAHIPGGFYRPIQMLIYCFINHIFGNEEIVFHLLNTSLHAANTCLVFTLGRRLSLQTGACFFAALLWGLHPIHTEAVTYMSATADPLFALFCLLTVLAVLPDFTAKRFAITLPLFVLALLSKETAVVAPALIIACIAYKSEHPWRLKQYFCTWPIWLVAAAFLGWRMMDINFDGPRRYALLYHLPEYGNLRMYAEHFSYRIYTFLATLPTYAALLVWPVGLHMERNFSIFTEFWRPQVLVGALMISATLFYLLAQRRREGKVVTWGLLWFAAAHAPDTGLFVIGNSLLLEHWMYLPTIGLFLGAAQATALNLAHFQTKASRHVVVGLCLIAAVVLTGRTLNQNEVWHDAISFYGNIFKFGEQSARAHNNMALAYMDQKQSQKAIDEFKLAIAMSDSYAETRHNLALAYINLPDGREHYKDAIAHLNRALEIDPHFYRSDIALSQIYKIMGNGKLAESYGKKAQADFDFVHRQFRSF